MSDKNCNLKVTCECKDSKDYELEVWKRLWQSRDFELQHFWQRSIFLTAFLVLGFTAYGSFQGVFLGKFFENKIVLDSEKVTIDSDKISLDSKKVATDKDKIHLDSMKFMIYNLISIFLCCVNAVLSILWIMMTKGSKNAYEVYENALESNDIHYGLKKAYIKLDSNKSATNSCILSTKAYRYSVSQINIFLGIFSLCIFSFLCIVHLVFIFCHYKCVALFALGFVLIYFLIFFWYSGNLIGGKN